MLIVWEGLPFHRTEHVEWSEAGCYLLLATVSAHGRCLLVERVRNKSTEKNPGSSWDFRCSGRMLSGPEALFDARKLMALSTSGLTMSAKRELSKSGDVSTYGCWCGRSACSSPECMPSVSKKSAHLFCILSLWYSASSKASLSVGAGWVLQWFLRRRKSFSELEAWRVKNGVHLATEIAATWSHP